jgi:hypothetical protein
MSNAVIRRATALAAASVTTGVAGWLALGSVPALRVAWVAMGSADPQVQPRVEDAVVLVCGTILAAVLAWLALGVLLCSVSAVRHGVGVLGEGGLLRPRIARALVATTAGAVVATASSATATRSPDPGAPGLLRRLDGLSLPDRSYGGIRTHRVVAGESLWSIAAASLPVDATGHDVAQAWPLLHRLNRDRVGPDPDLIHPRTTLRLPAWARVPTGGAPR